jgi:hypothetical protein
MEFMTSEFPSFFRKLYTVRLVDSGPGDLRTEEEEFAFS